MLSSSEPRRLWWPPATGRQLRSWLTAAGLSLWALWKPLVTVLPAVLLAPNYAACFGATVLLLIPVTRLTAVVARRSPGIRGPEALPSPYLPLPRMELTAAGWWWNGYDFHKSRALGLAQRPGRWYFTDPATWRDLAFLVLDPIVAVMLLVPVALVVGGCWLATLPSLWLGNSGGAFGLALDSARDQPGFAGDPVVGLAGIQGHSTAGLAAFAGDPVVGLAGVQGHSTAGLAAFAGDPVVGLAGVQGHSAGGLLGVLGGSGEGLPWPLAGLARLAGALAGPSGQPAPELAARAIAGILAVIVGVRLAPIAVDRYRGWVRRVLGPSPRARLARRVESLFAQRGEAVDAQAAELRRIERDLHDGAQARLVAIGMTVDAVEQLVRADPEKAMELLSRVRGLAGEALRELRELVHGIHPPMLAERGLGGAVEALAYDLPIPARVKVRVTGRPPAPVESAVYLVVSELLTNVVKHARARHTSVSLWSEGTDLRIEITDDGVGGADPAAGTGLRGVERRLAALDGVLECDSPPGGPTRITILLPGALPAADPLPS